MPLVVPVPGLGRPLTCPASGVRRVLTAPTQCETSHCQCHWQCTGMFCLCHVTRSLRLDTRAPSQAQAAGHWQCQARDSKDSLADVPVQQAPESRFQPESVGLPLALALLLCRSLTLMSDPPHADSDSDSDRLGSDSDPTLAASAQSHWQDDSLMRPLAIMMCQCLPLAMRLACDCVRN